MIKLTRSNDLHSSKGFSLLEILVAFSILALSLGVLFQIYSRGMKMTSMAKDYTQAVVIAQSRLSELDSGDELNTGENNGTDQEKFHWLRKVSLSDNDPAEIYRSGHQLYQVEVSVDWQSVGKNYSLTLNSMRLTNK